MLSHKALANVNEVFANVCHKSCTTRPKRLKLMSMYFGRHIRSSRDITNQEWMIFRDEAYPNWYNDNWDLSPGFITKLKNIQKQLMGYYNA